MEKFKHAIQNVSPLSLPDGRTYTILLSLFSLNSSPNNNVKLFLPPLWKIT